MAAFHLQMLKEANEEDEEEVESQDVQVSKPYNDLPLTIKSRLYGNPTPFPKDDLLEKLSNKLAEEEQEIHDNFRNSLSGNKGAKVDQEGLVYQFSNDKKHLPMKRGRKSGKQ